MVVAGWGQTMAQTGRIFKPPTPRGDVVGYMQCYRPGFCNSNHCLQVVIVAKDDLSSSSKTIFHRLQRRSFIVIKDDLSSSSKTSFQNERTLTLALYFTLHLFQHLVEVYTVPISLSLTDSFSQAMTTFHAGFFLRIPCRI